MAERVQIFDTTLRDGEQSPGCSMTRPREAPDGGASSWISAWTSSRPASRSPRRATSRRSRLIAGEIRGVTVAGLARACEADITRAAQALEGAERPRIHTFIATSDIHLKYKLRKSREQVLDEAVAAVRLARRYVDDVEFSAEDATRTELEYLERGDAGGRSPRAPRTVNIPDTVGYCTPDEFGSIIAQPRRRRRRRGRHQRPLPQRPRPRGRQLAGRRAGGRPAGRVHDQRHRRAGRQLRARGDRDDPRGPRRTACRTAPASTPRSSIPASQLLSSLITFGPQPNKSIVGRNAFAHEAGIHQDGVLKERTTYEIIDPASVGVPESRLVLGKHSGRHALRSRLREPRLLADAASSSTRSTASSPRSPTARRA